MLSTYIILNLKQESRAGARGHFYAYLGGNNSLAGKGLTYRIFIHHPEVRIICKCFDCTILYLLSLFHFSFKPDPKFFTVKAYFLVRID